LEEIFNVDSIWDWDEMVKYLTIPPAGRAPKGLILYPLVYSRSSVYCRTTKFGTITTRGGEGYCWIDNSPFLPLPATVLGVALWLSGIYASACALQLFMLCQKRYWQQASNIAWLSKLVPDAVLHVAADAGVAVSVSPCLFVRLFIVFTYYCCVEKWAVNLQIHCCGTSPGRQGGEKTSRRFVFWTVSVRPFYRLHIPPASHLFKGYPKSTEAH